MRRYYIDQTIVQYTKFYHFYANTYDKSCGFTIDSSVNNVELPFRLVSTTFFHLDFFKYQNVSFNLNNVAKIHYVSYFVSYLLT